MNSGLIAPVWHRWRVTNHVSLLDHKQVAAIWFFTFSYKSWAIDGGCRQFDEYRVQFVDGMQRFNITLQMSSEFFPSGKAKLAETA
jgi:hypothetical protein